MPSNYLLFLSTGCAEDMKLVGDVQSEDTGETEELLAQTILQWPNTIHPHRFKMLS